MPCLLLPLRSVLPRWSSDPANCTETASISSKWRSSLCVCFSLPVSSKPVSDLQSGTCEVRSLRRDRFGLKLHNASAKPEFHKPFVDALDNVQKTCVAAKNIVAGHTPSSGSLILRFEVPKPLHLCNNGLETSCASSPFAGRSSENLTAALGLVGRSRGHRAMPLRTVEAPEYLF
jgi:hypothetical protein